MVSAEKPLLPARSGRPTSPMKSVSPVSTIFGAGPSAVSITRREMLSGVWPGVSSTRRTTWPTRISSPSRTARCGKLASALALKTTAAPVRSASSRKPLTKSAWRWVSTT